MGESLVQLVHEHMVVGNAKVSVRVTTELVVTIDHLSNASHHPLSLIHWAHTISITIEHSDWGLLDVAKWDVGGDSVFFAHCVVLCVLLEPVLNTILEEVSQCLRGEWLLGPDGLLLTPHATKMRTNLWLVLLPVLPTHGGKSNHVDIIVDVLVVVITSGSTKDVHLGARGKEDGTSQVVVEQLILFVGQGIEQGSGTLVVANVNNFVSVANKWLLNFLRDHVLDMLQHSWSIIVTNLGKGPIPVLLSIITAVI